MPKLRRLRRPELPTDTVALALYLLGKYVVRQTGAVRRIGRIVETEAYPVGDPAAHSFIGPTRRNRTLFLKRGHAYVYFAYGSAMMLNVSSETPGVGAGVLIRALDPVAGIERMRKARGVTKLRDLTRGPGRLAQALDVDLRLDGVDLCAPGELWLATASVDRCDIGRSTRVGITRNANAVLRFFERGNAHVSGPRSLNCG